MSILIREATDTDLPAVLELYAQPELDDGNVLDTAEAALLLAQFRRYPSYRLFVACDEGAIVGTFAMLIMHNLAHRGTPSAIVEDVAVSPTRQSQGIGRDMMIHAIELARRAGCYKLALSSNLKRYRAHAFYLAQEFKPHGISFAIET